LTIIAICLVALTMNTFHIFPEVNANDSFKVNFANTGYGLVPVNEDGSISVRLTSTDEIDVNISNISTSDELEVNLAEIGGGYVSYGGPISVKID
jgi:hypothetical protein